MTAAVTITKDAAGYVGYSVGQRCGDCNMFRNGTRACTLVLGRISPNGWCRYWTARRGVQ